MKDEVQAEKNKKLGKLLFDMRERAFKGGNPAEEESYELVDQEQEFVKIKSRKLQEIISQIDGKSLSD